MSAHLHDGGLAFPKPVHTIRAVQCETMLQLLEPYGANQPRPTGAAWNANPLTMILRAAGAPADCTLGALYDADWETIVNNMSEGRAPRNWQRVCKAWALLGGTAEQAGVGDHGRLAGSSRQDQWRARQRGH